MITTVYVLKITAKVNSQFDQTLTKEELLKALAGVKFTIEGKHTSNMILINVEEEL